jgi:hypothetical protein
VESVNKREKQGGKTGLSRQQEEERFGQVRPVFRKTCPKN